MWCISVFSKLPHSLQQVSRLRTALDDFLHSIEEYIFCLAGLRPPRQLWFNIPRFPYIGLSFPDAPQYFIFLTSDTVLLWIPCLESQKSIAFSVTPCSWAITLALFFLSSYS